MTTGLSILCALLAIALALSRRQLVAVRRELDDLHASLGDVFEASPDYVPELATPR
jgi:hypothetical protein